MADDTRPDPGTTTGTPEPAAARSGGEAAPAPAGADGGGQHENGDRPAGSGTPGAPRKRRRGSRGGRGRKKPNPGGEGGATPASGPPNPPPGRVAREAQDWNDAAADRGLTADDVAAVARAEAEGPASPPAARPKIGDRRPAPPPPPPRPAAPAAGAGEGSGEAGGEGGAKKKRRRRGGRGRSRSGTGAGTGTGPAANAGGGGGGGGGGGRGVRTAEGYVDAGALGDVDVDGTALLDTLDAETLERRRGEHRKGRPAGRYLMVVHQRPDGIAHLAVLEGRQLVEHYVSTPTDEATSIDGNIYLGKVQNVLPGMEAAFVDIGTPKNAVLYRGDLTFDPSEVEGGERPRIERVLRNGQSILVQVTKNPIAHKGARLTQEVSLAGRFVVMVPGQPQTYGISKRLPDDERKRLRRVLDRVRPADAGLIVRTAAEGATEDELERDMRRLNAQWEQISQVATRARPGSLLYKEPPLAIRLIREEFTKEFRGIVIDDRALYEDVRGYIEAMAPELADRVEFYDPDEENLPVFEKFHVHEQLHKALDRKVWLPSGGSLVIERTEALTVIDVNTGKNIGRSNLEETVYRNNLEAAEVVARELRLRDIGGIIVIDFIDMEIKANRAAVEDALREALARDKTRTQVFPISELGLVEMTRKRVSEGLVEAFSSTCVHCEGRGFVVDASILE
ncbi:MAG: Rne/Rng family ribonuclease [Actinomycetota bacterium]